MDITDIKKRKATLFSRISYNKKKGNDVKDLEKELKELNKQLEKLESKGSKKKETNNKSKKATNKRTKNKTDKKVKKAAEPKSNLNPKWDVVIEGCKIPYKTKKYDDDSNLKYLEELRNIGCKVEYEYADRDETTYTKIFVEKSNDFYGVFSSTREAYTDLKKWKWI